MQAASTFWKYYQLQITPATWDIDLNGEVDALTDGLLMLRHTFNLSGDALVNGAVASNSSYLVQVLRAILRTQWS